MMCSLNGFNKSAPFLSAYPHPRPRSCPNPHCYSYLFFSLSLSLSLSSLSFPFLSAEKRGYRRGASITQNNVNDNYRWRERDTVTRY